jgi:hypothetical protein
MKRESVGIVEKTMNLLILLVDLCVDLVVKMISQQARMQLEDGNLKVNCSGRCG